MIVLLLLHALIALLLPRLASRLGPAVFAVGALAPLASFGWLLTRAPAVTAGGQDVQAYRWAPALGLSIDLRLDGLALLFGLLVTGVGALALLYGVRYFAGRTEGLGRLSCMMTLFAGSMLALVLADHVLTLYVAWELTTVCSFLLIGDQGRTAQSRRAALRALVTTTGGGFGLLLGLLLLGDQAGSYRISRILQIVPTLPSSGLLVLAVALVLLGALTKSAQVPFHPWLPAAMVAPTPVTAYLHAAAMVKAGVYLVARLAPALAHLEPWRPTVLAVGLLSMLLGGWRALAQHDLKRLLAFGTVAQLGFLLTLVGAGQRVAALAGATMIVAHGLFKSALFMVVGVIDHAAGTRDLRQLDGVGRRSPALAVIALLACLSMAGLPPFVGYLGKEAAFEAFASGSLPDRLVLAGLVAGSVLTVAYTVRFLWGAFGTRPGAAGGWHAPPAGFLAAPAALALAGLGAGLAVPAISRLSAPVAQTWPAAPGPGYHLALWHGWGLPVWMSLLTLAGGIALHLLRAPVSALHGRGIAGGTAAAAQDRLARATLTGARALTGGTQVGSLPVYLAVTLTAIVTLAGSVLVVRTGLPRHVRWFDTPAQLMIAVVLVPAVLAVVTARHRMTAVLMLSAVGFLVAGLFVVHGAPDLALAQVLVETLTLLVFVLVVRRMPNRAAGTRGPARLVRLLVAAAVGVFMTAVTLATAARHVPSRVAGQYLAQAPEHGGPNAVNVVITEFRGLDTLGEISVLALASTGVASLVLVSTRTGRVPRIEDGELQHRGEPSPVSSVPRSRLLPAAHAQLRRRRVLLLEVMARAVYPSVLVVAAYLLVVGLHRTGGGFAAGLLLGLALVLRYLAGGVRELGAAAPLPPGMLLGSGLVLAAGYALLGVFAFAHVLGSAVAEVDLGPLGHLQVATSLVFEVAIALIVLGLVVDVLRTLGSPSGRQP